MIAFCNGEPVSRSRIAPLLSTAGTPTAPVVVRAESPRCATLASNGLAAMHVKSARYLTIVPLPENSSAREGPGAAAMWFPVVGLAIGGVLAVVDRLASAVFAPLLAALVTVTAWKLVTGVMMP